MSMEKCNLIYEELASLQPTNDTSWNRLRDLISEVKDISNDAGITIYNLDLSNYLKWTWRGGKNCGKDRFKDIRQELRGTVLNLSIRLRN